MKDDIDSILESMFKNGRLNFGAAKQNQADAADALDKVNKSHRQFSAGLEKSIADLSRETQLELGRLENNLKQDGLAETDPPKLKEDELTEAFQKTEKQVCGLVFGQEEYIKALAITFKRPFVTGTSPGKPASRAVIIGKNGTGKHYALENFTAELQNNGVLKSGNVIYIDLARYKDTAADKVFLQDIYPALHQKGQIVAFENFEYASISVLRMISELFLDGEIKLPSRYISQKGTLVDIGTALVPNAISEIDAEGKYLFMITERSETEIANAFGSGFLAHCDDILRTQAFSDDAISVISDNLLKECCAKALNAFRFTLTYGSETVAALARHFHPEDGVLSLKEPLDALYKLLGEHKLKSGLKEGQGTIEGHDAHLSIRLAETVIERGNEDQAKQNQVLNEIKKEMADIIGLDAVKDYIYSLEYNLKMQNYRKAQGLRTEFPSMHMIFTGNPGTGKTTIARIISRYLKAVGLLSTGQLIEVTRADLVGRYVGHTAPLTQKAIESAMGGVLFIDEAYALYRGRDDSFGLEAIDTLVKGMEDHRDNLVVILAGYSHEMALFLESNSGLRSRFPNVIEFADYTAGELVKITKKLVHSKGYKLHPDCEEKLFVYYDIEQRAGDPRTNGNGRMARNKVEEAILNCSKRLMKASDTSSALDLELLLPEDFELNSGNTI